MSEHDSPNDTPRKSGAGKPLLVLLVLAAAALAAYYFMKDRDLAELMPAGSQLEEHAVSPAQNATELPIFAPKPLPGQPDPAASQQAPAAPAAPEATPSVTMEAAAPRTDKVLTLDFIEDLALYLAAAYQPGGTRDNQGSSGLTTTTFKKVNMRYGVELQGMDVDHADPAAGRKQALDHLMSPIVLRLAYNLFADDFMKALARTGAQQTREFAVKGGFAEKPLPPAQVRDLFDTYAARIRDIGRTFQSFASRPDLVQLMDRYFQAVRTVNAAYAQYADRESADAPDQELDAISLDIKKAITERESLRRELLRGTMATGKSTLTEGDVLDIAAWVSRRLAADPDAINAVGALASLSQEMADAMLHFEPTAQ